MKVITSELSGVALDWIVAKCEGYTFEYEVDRTDFWINRTNHVLQFLPPFGYLRDVFYPSSDWSQGGPIIEREAIEIKPQNFGEYWVALYPQWQTSHRQEGQTPLIAALRCYVASKLGDVIDIPDELMESLK